MKSTREKDKKVVKKNKILVIYDRFLKMAHFVATTKRTLAKGLARLFRNNVWKLHGLLESIISDRELQFVIELTKELNRMIGIEKRLSMMFCYGNY